MWSPRLSYPRANASALPTVSYHLFTPRRSNRGRHPLFCWLHGYGGRTRPVSPFAGVPDEVQPWFVLLPQAPYGGNWAPGIGRRQGSHTLLPGLDKQGAIHRTHTLLVALLDSLASSLPIDRVAIGGASMGGYATWDAIVRYPGRFAVALPMAGGGDPRRARLVGTTAVWAFHAVNDTIVPVIASRHMCAAVGAARGMKLERRRLDDGESPSLPPPWSLP